VSKNAVRTIFAVAAATALMMSLISPAGAEHKVDPHGNSTQENNGNNGKKDDPPKCPDHDTGHLFPDGDDVASLVVDGFLHGMAANEVIIGFCVKSGTDGSPLYVPVNPPDTSVTITFDGSKSISHFSLDFGTPQLVSTTSTLTPTTTPTTVAEEEVAEGEVLDAVETAPTAVLAAGTPVFTG
jgi:hypothetical protein